jgi:regulator of replication initiation timing
MMEKIDSTLKTVSDLKSGIGFFSKELDKIQSQLEELKKILNSQNTEAKVPQVSTQIEKKKKPSLVVRREDQEEPEIVTTQSYQIQVVGLGVQKIE